MEKKEPNRKRNCQVKFRCTEEELQQIRTKASETKLSLQNYIIRMCINGEIVIKDYSAINTLSYEVNKIGTNINQIARKINQTDIVSPEDAKEIKRQQANIFDLIRKYFVKLRE